MKCPKCGTVDTHVIATRRESDGLLVRRRQECGNKHRFNTYELHETSLRSTGIKKIRARLLTVASGIAVRSMARRRRLAAIRMLRQGKSVAQIADEIGVTEARVRQYRKEQS